MAGTTARGTLLRRHLGWASLRVRAVDRRTRAGLSGDAEFKAALDAAVDHAESRLRAAQNAFAVLTRGSAGILVRKDSIGTVEHFFINKGQLMPMDDILDVSDLRLLLRQELQAEGGLQTPRGTPPG